MRKISLILRHRNFNKQKTGQAKPCTIWFRAKRAVILLLLLLFSVSALRAEKPLVHVDVFESASCEHCQELKKEFYPSVEEKYPSLKIKYFDLGYPKNYRLLMDLGKERDIQISLEDLPILFIGKDMLRGERAVKEDFKKLVKKYEIGGVSSILSGREIIEEKLIKGKRIYLAYFFEPGCRECHLAEYMLKYFKEKYPDLEVRKFDIAMRGEKELLEAICQGYRVPDNQRLLTPAIFIGKDYFIKEIDHQEVEKSLEKYSLAGARPPWEGLEKLRPLARERIIERFHRLGVVPILFAGLLDGVNPCAFATILFLIAYLTLIVKRKRKEILFTGISFTFGVFLAYLLIGLGLLKALQVLKGITLVSKLLYPVIGGLVFILAIYNFKDYLSMKKGKFGEVTLQLPRFLKLGIHKVIREQTRIRYFIILAFVTGIIISVLELFCTGQVYLPTIMYILGIPGLKARALFYLILYALMFIVPLVIVFLLVYLGITSKRLEAFGQRHASTVKLLTVLLFLFFAIFMFIITAQLFGWL